MFFSKYMFVTKGKLAKVWLAAHWRDPKKLRKADVEKTNIEDSVQDIIRPIAPLALRVSGQLLVGVSRIYSRKVEFLFIDCSNTVTKMKVFSAKPGLVDLPPDSDAPDLMLIQPDPFGLESSLPTMTLDELAKLGDDIDPDLHVARKDDITLRDDVESSPSRKTPSLYGPDSSVVGDEIMDPLFEVDGVDGMQGMIGFADLPVQMSDIVDIDDPKDDAKHDDPPIETEIARDFHLDDILPDSTVASVSHGFASSTVDGEEGQSVADNLNLLPPADDTGIEFNLVEVEPPKKKPRRKRFNTRHGLDKKTELSRSEIQRGLDDPSDIVYEKRPRANMKKRQRSDFDSKADLQRLHRSPFFSEGMAPELVEFYERAIDAIPPIVEDDDATRDGKSSGMEVSEVPDPSTIFGGDIEIPEPDIPSIHAEEQPLPDIMIDEIPQQDEKEPEIIDRHEFDLIEENQDFFGHSDKPLKTTASGWSRRTQKMHQYLQNSKDETISFASMVVGKKRMTVAGIFHELLVLKSNGYINVIQKKPFEDIEISKLHKIDAPLPEEFEELNGEISSS